MNNKISMICTVLSIHFMLKYYFKMKYLAMHLYTLSDKIPTQIRIKVRLVAKVHTFRHVVFPTLFEFLWFCVTLRPLDFDLVMCFLQLLLFFSINFKLVRFPLKFILKSVQSGAIWGVFLPYFPLTRLFRGEILL